MPGQGVSEREIEELVREVVTGADLSQLTGKVVREHVLEKLGDRVAKNDKGLKRSVREALKKILASSPSHDVAKDDDRKPRQTADDGTSLEPAPPQNSVTRDKQRGDAHQTAAGEQEEDGSEGKSKANLRRRLRRLSYSSPEPGASREEEEQGMAVAKEEEMTDAIPTTKQEQPQSDETDDAPADGGVGTVTGASRAARDVSEQSKEEEDEEFAPEFEDSAPTRKRPVPEKEETDDDAAFDAVENATERKPKPPPAAVSPGKSPPTKRARSYNFSSEKHLDKLKTLCRQLGCKGATFRMRGKTIPEKCAGLVDYLAEKGVTELLSLTKKDIARHRARIEQEAEIAALDTSNIIEDGRRSRRGRSKAPNPEPKGELPSDFSGEELSASSAHEEDSDEYEASQDSD